MFPRLTGLVAAAHTPMYADGSLNLAAVERQAQHYLATGVTGAFVGGTTGESHSLTLEERLALAERWSLVTRGTALKLIIHVGANCQQDAVRMAAQAAALRADATAALAPSYFRPATVADLVAFLAPVAAAAAELPFYYYDIPLFTGVNLPMADFLAQGKTQMPNLAGLKFTNLDFMSLQQCLRVNGGEFDILFGFDEASLAAYALGVRGAVGSTYNFAAPLYRRMIAAHAAGDWDTARSLQAQSVTMIKTIASFGFPAAAKSVMAMIGIDCGPVRSPLRNLTGEQRAALERALREQDVLAK